MITQDMVGKRVLVDGPLAKGFMDLVEVKVLEFSPSQEWVKLQGTGDAGRYWLSASVLRVVEELEETEPDYAELWREIAEAWEGAVEVDGYVVAYIRGCPSAGLCPAIKILTDDLPDDLHVRRAMRRQLLDAVPEVVVGASFVWPKTLDGACKRAAVARRIEAGLRRMQRKEERQRKPIPGADFEEGMIRAAKRILEAYDAIDKEGE